MREKPAISIRARASGIAALFAMLRSTLPVALPPKPSDGANACVIDRSMPLSLACSSVVRP